MSLLEANVFPNFQHRDSSSRQTKSGLVAFSAFARLAPYCADVFAVSFCSKDATRFMAWNTVSEDKLSTCHARRLDAIESIDRFWSCSSPTSGHQKLISMPFGDSPKGVKFGCVLANMSTVIPAVAKNHPEPPKYGHPRRYVIQQPLLCFSKRTFSGYKSTTKSNSAKLSTSKSDVLRKRSPTFSMIIFLLWGSYRFHRPHRCCPWWSQCCYRSDSPGAGSARRASRRPSWSRCAGRSSPRLLELGNNGRSQRMGLV